MFPEQDKPQDIIFRSEPLTKGSEKSENHIGLSKLKQEKWDQQEKITILN